ncbi:hypothetical protein SLEP1_g9759 [Rubroshorea leprosula]|uniref:H/ACA ribonucleoprotein complex non-core subunit NAF1 n=1 Tax=Rubroshorea leprosula TaxID=152421 RepID=A0AAV5I5X5_9ROSI|nr:hypothetical protein SLEP1_g9759 [Rubroshorea leprosula]
MVGFICDPSSEEDLNQASNNKGFKDPFDTLDTKINDSSFADSFLDFDSIKDWFEDNPNPDKTGLEDSDFGLMEIGKEDCGGKRYAGSESVEGGLGCELNVKVEAEEQKGEADFSCCIEEGMGKVSLVGGSGNSLSVDVDHGKGENADVEDESVSSSSEETESESSTSSSSSDDDDEGEEEEELKTEMKRELDETRELEEGEIREVGGTGSSIDHDDYVEDDDEAVIEYNDPDDEDDDSNALRGPIRSKNEVQDLPPVPPVDVSLLPHHEMLPVGVILTIVDAKVIVEGSEKHNPLHEGSVLWITDKRQPLGLVDEIFGPVKNPYYVVRYNSESEVPAGIHEGNLISFVPEFASHVLNDKNLYRKGYDASGEHDEEVSDDGEFSDDEKEAEYKRMQKMEKRGMSDQRHENRKGNKKKIKNRDGAWKNGRHTAIVQAQSVECQKPPNQNRHNLPPVAVSLGNPNCSSSVTGPSFVSGPGFIPPFSVMPQSASLATPSNGVWSDGIQCQQPQNSIFPNGFPAGLPWLMQNQQQSPFPMPLLTPVPMPMPASMLYQQQQFHPSQNMLPNMVLPGGQSNLLAGPSYGQSNLLAGPSFAPWLEISCQNGLNPFLLGMGLQGQQPLNAVQEGSLSNELNAENRNLQQSRFNTGNLETSQKFNIGASSSRGRRPYYRGGGRFGGRRGQQQPK